MNWQEIVKQYELDVSVVNFDELIGRVDAEYYKPIYIENIQKIKGKEYKLLKEVSIKITDFGAYSQNSWIQYLDSGKHIFIRNQDIEGFFIKSGEKIYISDEVYQKLSLHLEERDILIQRAGTLGKASIVLRENLPSTANQNLAQVKVNETLISPFYLIAFLNCFYGISSFERLATGNVQPWLNLEQINNLPIPIPNDILQSELTSIIISAKRHKDESSSLYSQAEALLLSELGLADYVPKEANTSIRDLFECLQDDRFDAEYWMPKYEEMQKRVAKVSQSKLGQIVNHKKGVEVGSEAYQEEGENFIRVSDFSIYGIEGVEKKISNELYENLKKNYQPKKGEVLFTKDGTIGLSYALDEDIKGVLSGAFLRLQPKTNINIHYLALVLNSLYCKYQIERMSGGAIIAHLKPESAMQINIPILSQSRQDELGNMVIQSLKKRNEAKSLLEKAKRAVEIFIEQDEAKALEYLAI